MKNPLEEFPLVRKWAYRLYWVVGLVLGGIQVFNVAMDQKSPPWVAGALAVLAYVGIATNYTADQNVSVGGTPVEADGELAH